MITYKSIANNTYCVLYLIGEVDWRKGKKDMNKKITKIVYTDEPIKLGKTVVAKDFLPPPEALVFKQDTKKVTLSLTSESIIFFKQQAKKHDVKYQVMIRNLLDKYTRSLSPATS